MKRDWLHFSPHGTAKERFARIGRALTGPAGSADTGSLAEGDLGPSVTAMPDPTSSRDDLGEFFRNVAAGAHAHDLGDESLYLAEELASLQWSLSPWQKRALALLLLATMISARNGSSCVPLGRERAEYLGQIITSLVHAGRLDADPETLVREIQKLTQQVSLDQIIGRDNQYRPLIVEDDRVYQHRMLWCENQLAARLRACIYADAGAEPRRRPGEATSGDDIDAALAEVLARPAMAGEREVTLSAEQSHAVRRALSQRFTVVSGGPGTGKTAIVVTMLRVLRRLGEPVHAIALAAPTGKAANRMWSSIRRGLSAVADRHPLDDELLSAGVEPQTLHRLLGYMPGIDRFRHHDNNPLSMTTVIVDEASMIDLTLMERLLGALMPRTRLVLLGDADQLPSVDAGAVLRDLVVAGQGHGPASGHASASGHALGHASGQGYGQGDASGRRPRFAVRLTHSYRMDPANPAGRAILTAAREINAGNAEALLAPGSESPGALVRRESPSALTYSGVELLATGGELSPVHTFIDTWYKHRIAGQAEFDRLATKTYQYSAGAFTEADAADLDALFAIYESSRLLTVTRRQTTGSEALNRRLHRRVLADASIERLPDFYPGEPVMMRRNDYERGLFNGDQGMIVRVSEDGGPQHFRVVFPRGTSYVVFHLDALRSQIELSFAMTVHKSQGSEFDEVALILPLTELPLLTRELLYTGITRARRGVVLVGTEELVRVATSRPGQRFSGLAEKLLRPPEGEGRQSVTAAIGGQHL